ncbi:exported hypothetical protein [uncultured Defluviicoccus sp.]|uniref:Uncharacterized protein n=1 Tax=metagenome TaxID=256318 RepID=A0A380TJ91_9ZZZZ|nr:exported hypothetical protein [uncultured Defluviicoccus sp.]
MAIDRSTPRAAPRATAGAGLLPAMLAACLLAFCTAATAGDPVGWINNPNDDPAFGDATPGERFGEDIVLDGDRLAVGAMQGYDSAGRLSGRVRVFQRDGGGWTVLDTVSLPEGQDYAFFGAGLAMQGDTLVVGAPGFDSNGHVDAGAAHVFTFDGTAFQRTQVLYDTTGASRYLGATIALDGDTLVIGRRMATGSLDAGEVEVHQRVGGTWVLREVLRSPTPTSHDSYGSALLLDGDLLVVGAPYDAAQRGAAYVYGRDGTQWTLRQQLAAPVGDVAGYFGSAIAGDAERLLIGAPSLGDERNGAAFEWRRGPGGWTPGQRLSLAGQSDLRQFGIRVARHGTRWLVGALRGPDLSHVERVEVYGYLESNGTLVLERQTSIQYFGNAAPALGSIALDTRAILLGMPFSDAPPWSAAGEVRVVSLTAGSAGMQSLNTGAAATLEQFGSGLVATDEWLLVGSPVERRRSARSGAVYAWRRGVGAWEAPVVITGPGLVPPGGPGSGYFGRALAVSGDTVLVGAPRRQGGGSTHAFVFDGQDWQATAEWRPAAGPADGFGERIAADDDGFVVSARGDRAGGAPGAVHVIRRQPGGWAPAVRLVPNITVPNREFGSDVAIAGPLVAVAAQQFELGAFGQPILVDGAAHVFGLTQAGWTELARVERPQITSGPAGFGSTVALRDGLLAVGAPKGGEVHLFTRQPDGTWSASYRIDGPAAEYAGFGSRIRFVGDALWVAAPVVGALFRYVPSGGGWRLAQRIDASNVSPDDNFGADFTVEGHTVFAGAPFRGGHRPAIFNTGAVWGAEVALFTDGFEP